MLDQRLVRENPNLLALELSRRGIKVDLNPLQLLAQQQRDLEKERSTLQAKGNLIGKEVGQKIKSGLSPQSIEISQLKFQGNEIKKKVGLLEEKEKALSSNLKTELLRLPNLPSPECPDGKTENDNCPKP